MKTDEAMKTDYALVLKQLQAELDGMDARQAALQATIAGLKSLISADEQPDLIGLGVSELPRQNGKPAIPPGFFVGKTPTQGYRDFIKLWPGDHKPPEIADAFQAGGMETESRTKLVQAIHSVLKRERIKRERYLMELVTPQVVS